MVDFVSKYDVGEDWFLFEVECVFIVGLMIDFGFGDVGGKEIWCKLDLVEVGFYVFCYCFDCLGFG